MFGRRDPIQWGLFTLLLLPFTTLPAARAIDIDGVLTGSLDQPRANIIVYIEGDPDPLSTEVEDLFDLGGGTITTYNIEGFYDTGAGTVLIGQTTALNWGLPIDPGVEFIDAGVAGSEAFQVSQNVTVHLAPYAASATIDDPATFDTTYTHIYTDIRAAVGPHREVPLDPIDQIIAQYSEFNVFGMPLMDGKVVVMDGRGLNAFVQTGDALDPNSVPQINTYVYNPGTAWNPGALNSNPGIPPQSVTNYTIPLSYGTFDDWTITNGGAPPSLAHNPFIGDAPILEQGAHTGHPGVVIQAYGGSSTGSWLFDTGAAATILSSEQALNVNVRYVAGTEPGSGNEPQLERFNESTGQWEAVNDQFELTLGGVGGQTKVAGFTLDSLEIDAIRHDAGGDVPETIRWLNVPVLVADVSIENPANPGEFLTLDGIFGMNLLFASMYVDEPLNIMDIGSLPMAYGAFDWVVFDETAGTLSLAVMPEPGTMLLMLAGSTTLLIRRKRLI